MHGNSFLCDFFFSFHSFLFSENENNEKIRQLITTHEMGNLNINCNMTIFCDSLLHKAPTNYKKQAKFFTSVDLSFNF